MQRFGLKTAVMVLAAASLTMLAQGIFAQDSARADDDAFNLSVPKPEAEAMGQENLECGTEMITGSGPGFTDDRIEAEDVAIADWKKKAAKVFPDTELDFDLSKDGNLSCAVQGLYSKCFADGIPCKSKE